MFKKIAAFTGLQRKDWLLIAAVCFLFCGYYSVLLYKQISSDIQTHAAVAHAFVINNDKLTANFLYFILIALLTGFSANYHFYYAASVLLLAAALGVKFGLNVKYIDRYAPTKKRHIVYIASLAMLFVFALPNISFLQVKDFYLGQLAPNVWHNSTVIFLMPFAILLFFKSYQLLFNGGAIQKKDIIGILVLIILNALIKPSFLFTLLPSVFLFIAVRFLNGSERRNTVVKLLPYAAGILFIAVEYYVIYRLNYISAVANTTGADSGVVLAPFEVWGHFSKNIPVAFLSSLFFPVLYFILYGKRLLKNRMVCFAAVNFIIGIAEWSLLAEEGVRKFHGNFYWQVVTSAYLLFLTLVIDFLQHSKEFKLTNWKHQLLAAAFALHFLWGIFYWVKIIIFRGYN